VTVSRTEKEEFSDHHEHELLFWAMSCLLASTLGVETVT
jgi:hypothetical protein